MNVLKRMNAATRILLSLIVLFIISFIIDAIYGDLRWDNFHVFTAPLLFTMIIYFLFSFGDSGFKLLKKRSKYTISFFSFIFVVMTGSLPFMLSGRTDPVSSLFESVAGFTTTGLTTFGSDDLSDFSHGLLFFRIAIQWVGGLFYLIFAFMFLSEISDVAKRSVDRVIFSRIGLIPTLSALIVNLTAIYGLFTFLSFILFSIAGRNVFDALCLALGTVSTGGLSSQGNIVADGTPILLLVSLFMFTAGTGYYVHMSVLSARGRSKTIFDSENISYLMICLTMPVVGALILVSSGMSIGDSLLKGLFTSMSAISTTGFMVEGMNEWPDSMKVMLLLLMLLGGSTLSVSSGFKVHRFFLLIRGFFAEVKRSSHTNAVISLKRGEGSYSENALESANMSFFYLFSLLVLSVIVVLIFHDDIFEALTLCVTSISNSGITFGEFSTPEGISSLNWFLKITLSFIMILGRFEILLPIYIITMRGRRFTG